MTTKLTNEQFIQKGNLIHNNLYDYSLVDYIHSQTKVKIICPVHGVYEQIPSNHLSNHGCPICGKEAQAKTRAATAKSEFATKAALIHDSKYTYELVDYKNSATKVSIICPSHGIFLQTPDNHLNKSGCPICALTEKGWTRTNFAEKCTKNNNGLGILYILGCWSDDKTEVFIKIRNY